MSVSSTETTIADVIGAHMVARGGGCTCDYGGGWSGRHVARKVMEAIAPDDPDLTTRVEALERAVFGAR